MSTAASYWVSAYRRQPKRRVNISIPTVLRVNGFLFTMYFNEHDGHARPHVHVTKGGGVVVVAFSDHAQPTVVRVRGDLKNAIITQAVRWTEEHHETLMRHWRRVHG